jgi:hypothetical protein
MDPDPPAPPTTKDPPGGQGRKEWWLKLGERLIGPVLWLLAKWIDRLLEQHAHS